jgi:hypothetical protein
VVETRFQDICKIHNNGKTILVQMATLNSVIYISLSLSHTHTQTRLLSFSYFSSPLCDVEDKRNQRYFQGAPPAAAAAS